MTEDGFRDFEIRPAFEIQIKPSPDSDPIALDFTYDIIGLGTDQMQIQLYFDNPDYISASGISSDQIMITFWSTDLLVAENGLKVSEGQTITREIVPQIDPEIDERIANIALQVGIFTAVFIVIGLCITIGFNMYQAPFWTLFNTW